MKTINGYTLFFSKHDAFSNWFPSRFVVRGITFNCVEQYMMYYKAMMFGDKVTAAKIMKASHPAKHKELGREVVGYVDDLWVARRKRVVVHACLAKFSQNPQLFETLRMTLGTIMVEASPYDKIWGVGLGENDPRILDPSQWKGLNLLGEALMEARAILLPDAVVT